MKYEIEVALHLTGVMHDALPTTGTIRYIGHIRAYYRLIVSELRRLRKMRHVRFKIYTNVESIPCTPVPEYRL